MKLLLSIIVSTSVLAGSIGVNVLNSSCSYCEGEKVCLSSSSFSTELTEEHGIVDDCCSDEHLESEKEGAICLEGDDCCTNEFVKLKATLFIVLDSYDIEVSQKYLTIDFYLPGNLSFLPGRNLIIKRIPERPPSLLRPGFDFFSAFLC